MTGKGQDMTLDEFRALVASHGAEPRRWPADRRAAAEALLAADPAALAAWRDEQALDTLLDALAYASPAAGPDLVDGIVRKALAARRPAVVWPFRNLVAQAAALAACLVLGIGLGFALPEEASDAGIDDEIAALVLGPLAAVEGDLP